MRIVSLLPSATDIVCSLGLRDQLVGRTHECDWPPGIDIVPVMTRDVLDSASMTSREIDQAVAASVHRGSSIYALDHDALAAARPDLIVTQELCDVCAVSYREVAVAARMLEASSKVISLEPQTLDEILLNVETVGELTDTSMQAKEVVEDARRRLDAVRSAVSDREPVSTVCIEWLDPIFDAGHWVPEQVSIAGGRELLGGSGMESRRRPWEDVVEAQPDVLILLPCGLDLARASDESRNMSEQPGWHDIPAVREGRVWLVDGPAYFNRPGPRVVRGVEVLAAVLHGVGKTSAGEAVRLTQP